MSPAVRLRRVAFPTLILFGVVARAQCTPQWLPTGGFPGLEGPVAAATLWDADGGGPLPEQLVVSGTFTFAGAVAASNLAACDLATGTWSTMGGATVGIVQQFLTMPGGQLAAIGSFTVIGGVQAAGVATWNGAVWTGLGSSQTPLPYDGVLMPNGDLIVGGGLSIIGGYLARWNGSAWSTLATFPITGSATGLVQHLALLPNGDLVVAGDFLSAGGVPANRIARWNGTTFSPLGNGLPSLAQGLVVMPNGDVVAGLASAAGNAAVQRWNGASWSDLGTGLAAGTVRAFAQLPNGDLLAAGNLPTVARWNGASWANLGVTVGAEVTSLVPLANGDVIAAGGFDFVGAVAAGNVARWDGASWSALSPGAERHPPFTRIQAFARLPGGDLVAGGRYSHGESVLLPTYAVVKHRVARWNGSAWTVLGQGSVFATDAAVRCLAVLPNGDLVAGGKFTIMDGTAVANVARWNGSVWSPLGAGTNDAVDALAVLPNGDLVAAGWFTQAGGVACLRAARWNGVTWSAMANGFDNVVTDLVLWHGDLVACGWFTASGTTGANRIARWNGSAWSPLGAGIGDSFATSLLPLPDGDLLVGGWFSQAGGIACNRVARWNGAAWSAVGGGPGGGVEALARLPDGDVVAGGALMAGGGSTLVAASRFDGTTWSPFANLEQAPSTFGTCYALAFADSGDLAFGGEFRLVDGNLSPYVAHFVASCPASTQVVGSGCVGSGGLDTLVATSAPWLGSTFRATANGLPANAIGVAILGDAAVSLPLSAWFPSAGPNCMLLASPTVLSLHLVSGGQLATALPIPDVIALLGATVQHQVVSVELDAAGNLGAITSSNGLQVVLGAF